MKYPPGYEVFFCHRQWGASYSTEMFRRLWTMIRWADVVHLTGVYSPPTIPTLLLCRIFGKPLVWSPRGALQRWEHTTNRFSKKVWELICNPLANPERCLLHVTSKREAQESNRRIPRAAISVIRNGIDLPSDTTAREWRPAGQLRITYMGRLHPIKGIEHLIEAVHSLGNAVMNLNIFGAGDEGYSQSLRALVERLGLQQVVSFKGHVAGRGKFHAFLDTDICVVPSFSENFAMVVAEALAHAVPVIASKGTPWEDLEKHGCGLWVDNSPQELARAIRRLADCPLSEMGISGRNWMKEYYSWDKVSAEMLLAYRRLVAQA